MQLTACTKASAGLPGKTLEKLQWWGQLSSRMYNPQKAVKYGIKSYILRDSFTGYCFNMKPYVGEASTLPDCLWDAQEDQRGATRDHTCHQVMGAEGKIVRHNGQMMVLAWQDKQIVKMVTTCHQDQMQSVENELACAGAAAALWKKGQVGEDVQQN